MKDNKNLLRITILLLLTVLVSTSCTFELVDLDAIRTTEAEAKTAVPAPKKVILLSFHGRYVTATGEDDGWVLRQELELSNCGWFTLRYLDNGKVALETCHDKYVTAPKSGAARWDWLLGQESELGDCGQFDLYDLGSDRVAFKTCVGRFFTAGDANWDPGLEWSVIGETYKLETWEIFTALLQP